MPALEKDGDVFVLTLDDSENRFSQAWLGEVGDALDEVESAGPHGALVTVGQGKYWSNGLDLDWLQAHPDSSDGYLAQVHALFARTLVSPMATVAAVTGHAFAAGAMWALAHDHRIMRADRGYVCLPEIDLGLSFQPGMAALIQARLTPQVAHEAMTTGRRYGGVDAQAVGIVDEATELDQVLATALERAHALSGKSSGTRQRIKNAMYADVLAALHAPVLPLAGD